MYNEYKSKGFEIVSVNGIGDPEERIIKFMKDKGATFIGAVNKTPTDVVKQHKVTGYPTNVVIDREGNVVKKLIGFNEAKLKSALRAAGLEM